MFGVMAKGQRKIKSSIAHLAYPARHTLTGAIFGKIAEAGEVFLDVLLPPNYPEAKLWRNILGLDSKYEFKRETFAAIVSRLKAQGFVEGRKRGRKTSWRLTARGHSHFEEVSNEYAKLPRSDGKKRLVVFDIPEIERHKRRWLRSELTFFGYTQLQKSVWVGDTPLPEDFFDDLDTHQLRGKVHILRIEEEGSLV